MDKKRKCTVNILMRLVFVLSLPFLTLTFANSIYYEGKYVFINLILSFLCGLFLQHMLFKDESFKGHSKRILMMLLLTLFVMKNYCKYFLNNEVLFHNAIFKLLNYNISRNFSIVIITLLAVPSLCLLLYKLSFLLENIYVNNKSKISNLDKKYLFIVLIVGSILTIVLFNLSNVFFFPKYEDGNYYYDAIYTTDTAYLNLDNTYFNIAMPENDIRQPLFGVFSFPFAILAQCISEFLYFLPNSYVTVINIIQIVLLAFVNIMIAKMLSLSRENKILFYLFVSLSFPYILFSFVMEQYIFALFFLILAIYISYYKLCETNYMYIGAVGTLLTSGIIFPIISKFKNFKYWFKNCFKCFFAFFTIFVVSGQFSLALMFPSKLVALQSSFAAKVTFTNKLQQFTYFVQSLFFSQKGHVEFVNKVPFYRLNTIETFSIVGIVILLLCFISFIINRKNKFAKISFLWVLFSFLLLVVVGWGTVENGLILYSLYFGWAYFSLFFMLINKIVKSTKVKYIVFGLLIIMMLYFSAPEIVNILKFSIKYYCEKVIL